MISCTEFIPAYSELFTYLEETYGREEVNRLWDFLFKPTGDGIPLINFVKKEGIRGCWSYWKGTLNEEAADFTLYLNEKAGWYMNVMHECPSKGRLLKLKNEIGITPYHDYCLHCDSYRSAVEKVGLNYIYNFNGIDHAACSALIYDPKIFDGRVIIDENTEIMDVRAAQNEYFHRDFHSSMNMGIEYLGTRHGPEAVQAYLTRYTRNGYAPVLKAMEEKGLDAVEEKIRDTYRSEKAEDALEIQRDGEQMTVHIKYCPAVKYLKETGRAVSQWYRETTQVVMSVLAAHGGFRFVMEHYDENTGAASYRFQR
ncbi:MAG: hypothetical protein VB055_06700 [Oscillospiraceae bacterium]|nr:hypothetical protein [Oscillospiraceae bacterium]